MGGMELKINEHIDKHAKGHKDVITLNEHISLDMQLKDLIKILHSKYQVFGNLLDSDLSQLLDSKIKPVKINGEWYIKLERR